MSTYIDMRNVPPPTDSDLSLYSPETEALSFAEMGERAPISGELVVAIAAPEDTTSGAGDTSGPEPLPAPNVKDEAKEDGQSLGREDIS